jgi:hypothetical protein
MVVDGSEEGSAPLLTTTWSREERATSVSELGLLELGLICRMEREQGHGSLTRLDSGKESAGAIRVIRPLL